MKRIDVTKPAMPPLEDYIEEIRPIWEDRWLTHTGPRHQKLEAMLRERLSSPEISLFCNGHQALEAAFSLFPQGGEVITTPFTFASTTLAIIRAGLTPVFCDIEPEFYTLDPEKIAPLITSRTVAVAPVHVYGNLCRWREIGAVAAEHGLSVVYDAAHAFGVREGGRSAAELGDLNMFSFHATKVFHTVEGGCLAHGKPKWSRYFAAWRQYGMFDGETSEIAGTNAKLTEFAAAMGLSELRYLDEQVSRRRDAVLRYRERLADTDGLLLCGEQPDTVSNYAYLPVQVIPERFGENRDELRSRLALQNINVRRYFYPLTSAFPLCRTRFPIQETPVAQAVSERILCLPLYADLTVEDVDRVCDAILERGKV